ncbi:Cell division protein [Candidatus Burkholderia humilis]|nr:Cell division protein [Candidatus Burkholderia humilis]
MNTSRYIEKLFDHFGGDAGNYQEIGRENEASTRWPLLATLDFAQPSIPAIAPRRDAQSIARPAQDQRPAQKPSSEPVLTPISRGKAPLFAHAHRRSIPPVNVNPSVDAHRATRFSKLAESLPETNVEPVTESGSALASAAAAIARANSSAQSQADVQPALRTQREEPAPSILGKLFDKPKPTPASNSSNSLNALFDRLRTAGDDPSDDTAKRPARAWGSRS